MQWWFRPRLKNIKSTYKSVYLSAIQHLELKLDKFVMLVNDQLNRIVSDLYGQGHCDHPPLISQLNANAKPFIPYDTCFKAATVNTVLSEVWHMTLILIWSTTSKARIWAWQPYALNRQTALQKTRHSQSSHRNGEAMLQADNFESWRAWEIRIKLAGTLPPFTSYRLWGLTYQQRGLAS